MTENFEIDSREPTVQEIAVKNALYELVLMERFVRDRGKFDLLRDLHIADSQVRGTGFSGTGAEFAEASRKQ